jgi:DNA-binding GntR family transcriptional regulator
MLENIKVLDHNHRAGIRISTRTNHILHQFRSVEETIRDQGTADSTGMMKKRS